MGTKKGKLTGQRWSFRLQKRESGARCLALLAGLMLFGHESRAQELELDLKKVFVPQTDMPTVRSGGGGGALPPMGLPFVDDFAWPSLADEEGGVTIKRWESSPVRRTFTLALDPPTLGCATLDGLDGMGNPYILNEANPEGYADTLTSRSLLLGNNAPGDSVALSFWYQSGGIANGADAGEDSLIVEFKTSIVDSDPWQWIWSTEGIDDDTAFRSVVVPIDATEYFHNGFQFRFRNYGSLEEMSTHGTSISSGLPKMVGPQRRCLRRCPL